MYFLRFLVAGVVLIPILSEAGEKAKKEDERWPRIIVAFITPEQSKKGIEFQEFSITGPNSELNLICDKLGAKLSMKAIRDKFGPPTFTEEYASRFEGKVYDYQVFHYPPVNFTTKKGSDQVETINAPKRLWGGSGILENAKAAMKK